MTESGPIRIWVAASALALAALMSARAQQEPAQSTPPGDVFSSSTNSYTDASSASCEEGNTNNPYAGMNPLVCYGVSIGVDSNGQCSLQGMTVWKQEGGTCYYCQPINPPIKGFLVPMDQLADADNQGFLCGVDQADPNCFAVCQGNGTFKPPGGVRTDSTPAPPANTGTKPILQGHVSNTPDACEPFGPGGYNYCDNPQGTQPAGCVCPQSQPGPPPNESNTPPKPASNPVADAGQYLQGVVAGFGSCIQGIGNGIGSLMAGAGFFAQGDFVDAATAWGLSPGQSVVLKAMYAEMTTPVVGQNVSPYEQGMTAGRRLCAYAAIPGAAKAVGTVVEGALSPGSTFTNPIKGSALQDEINASSKATTGPNPQSLANKWVQTPKGPVQLGAYAGQGSFATVFKYGKTSVIKLSRSNPETLGYGPESLEGQSTGAGRVQAAGVETPNVSEYEPGGTSQPSTLVTDDVAQKYPGAFELSNAKYHSLDAAEQGQVLSAVDNASNQIAARGYALLDVNPSNFSLQSVGNAMKAIIHDPDMVMTVDEIKNLSPTSVPRGVLNYALEVAGVPQDFLNQPFTAQSLTEVLNTARTRLITGITNVGSSTVKPPAQ